MYCGKCGHNVPDGVKFCPKCGHGMPQKKQQAPQPKPVEHKAESMPVQQPKTPTPVNQPKPVKKEKSSIASRIISIILCIFLFVFSSSAMTVGIARMVLSKSNVKAICSEVKLSDVNIVYKGKTLYLTDFIMDVVSEDAVEKYGISKKDVEKILDNKTINNYIEDATVEYVAYIAFGEEPEILDVDSILGMIKDCSKVIYDETGFEFTDADFEDLEDELKNGSMKFLIVTEIDDVIGFDPAIVSVVLSIPVLVTLCVLSVAMIVLLLLCNKCKVKYLFAYTGMTSIVLGAMMLLSALASFILKTVSDVYLVELLLNAIIFDVAIFGLVALVLGIVMFVLYRTVFNKKYVQI